MDLLSVLTTSADEDVQMTSAESHMKLSRSRANAVIEKVLNV